MYLKHLRPHQMREAIAQNLPLLIPAGCIELHGSQGALGLDTIAAEAICAAIAGRTPAVIAPTFEYGPTGYAVSGPDLGTLDVDNEHFYLHVKDVLRSLLRMGWQRIIVIIQHQGMDGPLALSFRKAAAELAFELTRAEKGEGWWGLRQPETHGNVWGRVRVMPTILPAAESVCRGDHAGHFETSLLMYLRPEMVDLSQLERQSFWFTDRPDNLARTSCAEDGRMYFEAMLEVWLAELRSGGAGEIRSKGDAA